MKLIFRSLGVYLDLLTFFSRKSGGKRAFLTFSTPFAPKLKDYQSAFLSKGEQSSIDFNGKNIKLYSWGNGEQVILCLHGWQSNSFHWKRYIEQVDKSKYTIIAMDALAHGGSEGKIVNVPIYSDLIERLLDHLGRVDFLLGHSIGCFASMHLFHHKPELSPPRLIFLAPPGCAADFVEQFAQVLGINGRTRQAMFDYFRDMAGNDVHYYDNRIFSQSMTVPGLIIHDKDDTDTVVDYAHKIHEGWPNSELHITAGFGHRLKDQSVVDKVLSYISLHSLQTETMDSNQVKKV